jgi:hypothetical protein
MKVPSLGRLVLVWALAGAACPAADVYVATWGDDSLTGSADAPFRTLSKAVNVALAGDTVVVQNGTYGHENAVTQGDGNQVEHAPVVLRNSGNPNAWITIRAANKWGAVLDCEMLCDAYIDLRNASFIVIQDFVIARGYKEGIHSNDAAHHIVLRGNRIEYIANRRSSAYYGLDGMYTNPQCHDFTIDGNVFHDIGRTDSSLLDHGLYLRGSNFSITNNIFYNIHHGWSIQTAAGLENVLIANNTFAFPNGDGLGGQIMLWRNQSNLTIRNNIFYQAGYYAILRDRSSINSCAIDHNLTFDLFGTILDSSDCTVDTNLAADPMFVNPSAPSWDFHLRPTSPAIGTGAIIPALVADFEGTARAPGSVPDLGAYVFIAGPPAEGSGRSQTAPK